MKDNWKIDPAVVFGALCFFFLVYSIVIYLEPTKKNISEIKVADEAKGRLVWQKYNCHTCHQLYGLGGYLGPDLTNVYSKYNGSDLVLKTLFKGGFKQMPTFKMTENEQDLLIAFLRSTDESGSSDPRDYEILHDGMIERNDRE